MQGAVRMLSFHWGGEKERLRDGDSELQLRWYVRVCHVNPSKEIISVNTLGTLN